MTKRILKVWKDISDIQMYGHSVIISTGFMGFYCEKFAKCFDFIIGK